MKRKKGTIKKILFGIVGAIVLFVVIVVVNLLIVEKSGSIVSEGQSIATYDRPNVALLVIDVQEATTGESSMYPFFQAHADAMINNINQVVGIFDDRDDPIIYVRSEITNPLVNLVNNSYAKGSQGARFDGRLHVVSGLEVIKSGKDSFRHTNLDSILIQHEVNELFIVGLDAAECINATVEAAQSRDYRVNLIDEAVLSKSETMKDSMMMVFKSRGVRVSHLDSLRFINENL